jgi:ribosomal protein S18 acetylase RimI-like enzyme
MRIDDWRHHPAEALRPLYETEATRWRVGLQWDLAPTLATLEEARAAGTLPGFVVCGPGRSIVGWAYFAVQDGILQIGSVLARSSHGVRLLLDAILRAPEAATAHDVLVFAFPESGALESALARRRFDVTRQWYMRRALDRPPRDRWGLDTRLRAVRDADGPDVVRLLAQSYAGQPAAQCFAPHGEMDEWARYVAQILKGEVLGRLVPEASLLATTSAGTAAGLALCTAVSPGTLHLAQLAVAPAARGAGLGGLLLDTVMAWGRANGHPLLTLLVGDDNATARALYTSRGFLPTGYFLYGRRAALRKTFDMARASRPALHPR